MNWFVVAFLFACGSKKEPQPRPATSEAGVTGDAVAVATDAVSPGVPPATCTDGGALAGAGVVGDEFRFCLDEDKKGKSCWGVTIAGSAIKPLDKHDALDGAEVLPMERDDNSDDSKKTPATWTAKVVEHTGVEVCGPDGCKPLRLVLASKDPDADANAVSEAEVSSSGKHVAVVRGLEMVSKLSIEIYDRESSKLLGVARPPSMCVTLQGFANETLAAAEWDCANQGGDRILVAPTGKIIARIARLSTGADPFHQIEGDRFAFSEIHTASIEIYDVVTGKRHGGRELEQFARVAAHKGRAYAVEPEKARVIVFDKDGKEIATARAPTCRYEWETESIGPLRLHLKVEDLTKAIGQPTKKTKVDLQNLGATTWTFKDGVTVEIHPNYQNEATGQPVPPWLVVGFALTAPSKHQIKGVGIGSTLDELKKAFGAHEVKSSTSDTNFAAGNEGDAGIVFTLEGGKVTRIEMGELRASTL